MMRKVRFIGMAPKKRWPPACRVESLFSRRQELCHTRSIHVNEDADCAPKFLHGITLTYAAHSMRLDRDAPFYFEMAKNYQLALNTMMPRCSQDTHNAGATSQGALDMRIAGLRRGRLQRWAIFDAAGFQLTQHDAFGHHLSLPTKISAKCHA